MAVRITYECLNCATDGYPCAGESCEKRVHRTYTCDKCKKEVDSDDLYDTDDGELCEDCLIEATLAETPKAYV